MRTKSNIFELKCFKNLKDKTNERSVIIYYVPLYLLRKLKLRIGIFKSSYHYYTLCERYCVHKSAYIHMNIIVYYMILDIIR